MKNLRIKRNKYFYLNEHPIAAQYVAQPLEAVIAFKRVLN
jgi:hypothetical protein